MLIVCQTLSGFFLSVFSSTFWALPITTVPKSQMGVVTGLINTAGQIAAFLSPLLVGYLVGSFGPAFHADNRLHPVVVRAGVHAAQAERRRALDNPGGWLGNLTLASTQQGDAGGLDALTINVRPFCRDIK